MPAEIHYLGIRHHGPGSARRLCDALRALAPARLLIEGPADASELLPHLGKPDMRPPVALLSHAADAPDTATFYPFAEFSPEYQAIRWALQAAVPVQFIDLPAATDFGTRKQAPAADAPADDSDAEKDSDIEAPEADEDEDDDERLRVDPIGALAAAAGYDDGESWWNDWIESATHEEPLQAFSLVADIMQTLRDAHPHTSLRERRREAHMRLAIAVAARKSEGPIVVVCGAWHVPALKAKHRVADDRALLAGLPKRKVQQTWVPWTYPRLAYASGYGAGVAAPRWYQHLWRHGDQPSSTTRWSVEVARALRKGGLPVSTASVIEAVRAAQALASLRERPQPGFEEVRDASVACLCGGEAVLWQQHERELLLGNDVGEIPADTPLMPLLEDLQRQQKQVKLKPEALPRELALDLRSDSGAARSTLLHRLRLLDVPWGTLEDAGRSRGTFRERWTLAWQPEFAVRLVEHLPYGTTIEQAAAALSVARLREASGLAPRTALIQSCLEAQLPAAVDAGLVMLDESAGHMQECREILEALPALIALHRYGTARAMSFERIDGLIGRLLVQAALALPYAARNLDAEQAGALCTAIHGLQSQLDIAERPSDELEAWWHALSELIEQAHGDARVRGLACRLAYGADRLDADSLQLLMQRTLSPGVPTPEAARFFEGFFEHGSKRLLHDAPLLAVVDSWLLSLDADGFQEQLPLLRRVFSELDSHERKRLLDQVLKPSDRQQGSTRFDPHLLDEWTAQQQRLLDLLHGRAPQSPKASPP